MHSTSTNNPHALAFPTETDILDGQLKTKHLAQQHWWGFRQPSLNAVDPGLRVGRYDGVAPKGYRFDEEDFLPSGHVRSSDPIAYLAAIPQCMLA
jgi:hypothetical protein